MIRALGLAFRALRDKLGSWTLNNVAPPGAVQAGQRSRFTLLLALVATLAFLIREYFVLFGIVDQPIRGDIRDYVSYAWNLVEHACCAAGALRKDRRPRRARVDPFIWRRCS